jgi:DNA (cytosine-5)-methyltransferase 1
MHDEYRIGDRWTLIDLFAGCGGLTLGFTKTGVFAPILAVESDADAAETYALNFGPHVFDAPIERYGEFSKAAVVVGGPPCQGFSNLNMARVGLERRGLWREYLRALAQAEPLAFVMENVPELLKSGEYAAFRQAAEARGYNVEGRILNAADYGVPQTRRRAIVIGTRVIEPLFPLPTHADPDTGSHLPSWRDFRWAVRDGAIEEFQGAPRRLSDKPDGANWHRPRTPTPLSLERYRAIPEPGQNRFDLQRVRPDITPKCWLNKPTGSTDVFGRLWWDRPTVTIRTEFYKPEKGRYLHPQEHRPITVREAARCMTFPDDFIFPEHQSMTSVGRQIGNAVPPLLAYRLAEALAESLRAGVPEAAAA